MHRFFKIRCNLLLLFFLLFYISSVNAAKVINCRQSEAVKRAKRQTAELTSQQQYRQLQRNIHEQRSSQTFSIYQPKVNFFTVTPVRQVQQQQASSGTQQRIVFITQQQQSAISLVKQQQQQQLFQLQQQQLTPPTSSSQSTNNQQYFQNNSYLQRQQQQQQVYNRTYFPRFSQQAQQQQQQQQQVQSQQFLQSQQQQLQFYNPQTTTATYQNVQRHIANQQAIPYQPQLPSQPQYESTPMPIESKGPASAIFSPLLPSYLDEDDMPLNYTLSCEMCCIPEQTPCQHCCDTNPLLSATVLKSSAG